MMSSSVCARAPVARAFAARPVRAGKVIARAEDNTTGPAGDSAKGPDGGAGGDPAGGEAYARTMNGISAPFGYFDPLGLAGGTTPEQVKRYREAELTHGRVSMLAALGFLVGEAVEDNNLFYNWDGGISGPAIIHFQQVKQGFWEPLVIVIGICEAYRVAVGWAPPTEKGVFTLKDEYKPGNLGFDPLGLCPSDKAEFDTLQTKEINNGRLAMISIAGMVAQELVNGKRIFETLSDKTS